MFSIKKRVALTLLASQLAVGCSLTSEYIASQGPVAASPVSSELTYVRTVEGIEEYQLANGLKVLLFPDPSQSKSLVNITYRVGSVHEKYGETGMAHLLEHMLFKGSTAYPDVNTQFKKRGMQTNATTWSDRTNYFELFDANPETLAWALGMEADRMVNATFTEPQLKSEMTVVRNEMERGENNPTRIMLARLNSMGFLWHNYANSTIGARSDVENFPFEKLRAFYNTHYRPDNAVLTVAGRFDKEQTKALIEKEFGKLVKPNTPIEQLYTAEPTQDGERSVTIRRNGDLPVAALMYHLPSATHQDTAAVDVLNLIFSDRARGRLRSKLVETGVAASAFSFPILLKDSSQFYFFANGQNADSDIESIQQQLITMVEGISEEPVTEEEVQRAIRTWLSNSEQQFTDVAQIGMELSEYIAKGDYRYMFYHRDLVEKVTAEQVQQVAQKYLIQSNRTSGLFIPTKTPKRAELEAPKSLNDVLAGYKGKEQVVAGEVYDNTVANIEARLKQTTLANGAKVSIYPKQLRGDLIHVSMNFPFGNLASLSSQETAMNFMASQLLSGTNNLTKEAIADKLDALNTRLMISASRGELNVGFKVKKQHLNETLDLLNELLTQASFPEQELAIAKRASVSALEAKRNDPGAVAQANFMKTIRNYKKDHPKAFLTTDEKIAAINAVTRQDMQAIMQNQITTAHGKIAIVGHVDSEEIVAKLNKALVAIDSDVPYQYLTMSVNDVTGKVVSTHIPDKANASFYSIHLVGLNTEHPDYPALKIATSIFGGGSFNSRIGERIRVKEGYSYSVGAGLSLSDKDDKGLYWAYAIAAPENMDKAIAAYREELEKVKAQGFTEEELQQAIAGHIASVNRSWANDASMPSVLLTATDKAQGLAYFNQQTQAIKSLDLATVNAAFNKYIANKEMNIFKAGTFE
ncbi:M16 family metallopeptidase [Thalassotalea sp. PLHSN55]|uniref:M16 family metallopeptidase n=1 Tax=Thalassotalea sp. PLHSN55 TaxID=3435888 RepID=UPI003F82DB6F